MAKVTATPITRSQSSREAVVEALAAELRSWWSEEGADWDALVESSDAESQDGGEELWDGMPVVDSKAVARTSPIFERHLGTSLDITLIRRGGYPSIDAAISDLIPKMVERVGKNGQ